jgi:precorrin-2/cobalt-factor-2 C20-methyltransferase
VVPLGQFVGIGVGPGPAGYIPLAAWQLLKTAQVVFYPRARSAEQSTALQCLHGLEIDQERLREIIYNMDSDRHLIDERYAQLAEEIAHELKAGKTAAYLTIGDSLTYSTYSYTLNALLQILPDVSYRTFPGITSYAAIASALNWPLGQGKERTLILPCPDDMAELCRDIETHDIVILMKIGRRLSDVLALLSDMNIGQYCAFASRIGLPGEYLCSNLLQLNYDQSLGYLSTMLIRRTTVSMGSNDCASHNAESFRQSKTEGVIGQVEL